MTVQQSEELSHQESDSGLASILRSLDRGRKWLEPAATADRIKEKGHDMNDNTTYELVYSPTPDELSLIVSDKINQGWWPLGTPFVHGESYVQAMIGDTSDHDRRVGTTDDD